jgi:hypothetical protein
MTANADVQRLMNNAMVHLPGATVPVMQQELFNVMTDFFQGSNVWNEDIPLTIPGLDPAGTVYLLAPQQPAQIDKLLWVFTAPNDNSIRRGGAIGAAMSVPGELVLNTQPSSDTDIIVTVALTVQDPADRDGYVQFPAWVLQKYMNVLQDGLIGKMMAHPVKPYTNMQLSVFHSRAFKSGISQARVEWTRNNTYRQQAWRFPISVGGSQRGRSSRWAQPQ